MKNQDIPTIYIKPVGAKTVKIRCPYCAGMHKHGRIEGHRLSHCVEDGHLKKRHSDDIGYYLKFE
jgi:hypothetical protein